MSSSPSSKFPPRWAALDDAGDVFVVGEVVVMARISDSGVSALNGSEVAVEVWI